VFLLRSVGKGREFLLLLEAAVTVAEVRLSEAVEVTLFGAGKSARKNTSKFEMVSENGDLIIVKRWIRL